MYIPYMIYVEEKKLGKNGENIGEYLERRRKNGENIGEYLERRRKK
jgi:hypothetical protein